MSSYSVEVDMSREADIIKLCKQVLLQRPYFEYDSNGMVKYTCPFCHITEYGISEMDEHSHLPECGYLIAKDLMTGYK